METAIEQDEHVMGKYLDGEQPDIDTLKYCIRKGTINLSFFPTYCGSSFKNKGVQRVLDAVIDYLPSPLDLDFIKGISIDNPEKTIERKR